MSLRAEVIVRPGSSSDSSVAAVIVRPGSSSNSLVNWDSSQ